MPSYRISAKQIKSIEKMLNKERDCGDGEDRNIRPGTIALSGQNREPRYALPEPTSPQTWSRLMARKRL